MKFQVLAFALFATSVMGRDCGNHGTFEENCCVCDAGYAGNTCTECASGYSLVDGLCGNGRDGTSCTDDGSYPFIGCGGAGECSNSQAGKVFPCTCTDLKGNEVSCATKLIEKNSCAPRGARMYTSFPNSPRIGLPFSLTVVTCDVVSPSLMMVPAYKEDGLTENFCNRTGEFGGFSNECVISHDSDVNSTSINTACTEGIVLTNLNAELNTKGMAEYTFAGLNVSNSNFYINNEENAANRNKFKICMSTSVPVVSGSKTMETVWVPVDGHNELVSTRDEQFSVVSDEDATNNRAATGLDDAEGGDCCDGLKIGFCLPLWAFLLLWLLMALCLGFLGFALHKNKNEIEAKKNNEKYEKFNTDAEMIEHAAKEADDDDI